MLKTLLYSDFFILCFFFFNDTATTEIYTLSLHDALPIYYSAGQSCEARSRVLVESSLYDEFVSSFSEAAKRLKVGDPLEAETQVGSLISPEHRDKVHGFVEQGREEGAEARSE